MIPSPAYGVEREDIFEHGDLLTCHWVYERSDGVGTMKCGQLEQYLELIMPPKNPLGSRAISKLQELYFFYVKVSCDTTSTVLPQSTNHTLQTKGEHVVCYRPQLKLHHHF